MVKRTKKKTISITVNGKSLLKVYGNAKEVQTFFDSVEDRDEQLATSFFDGDGVIEHRSYDMGHAAGEYEGHLGRSFRNLQRGLAATDDRVLDAASVADFPLISAVGSYEDRLGRSFRAVAAGDKEAEYPSLSSVVSYEDRLGRQLRDLQAKLCGMGCGEAPPSPPSPTSVDAMGDSEKEVPREGERPPSSWGLASAMSWSWGKSNGINEHQMEKGHGSVHPDQCLLPDGTKRTDPPAHPPMDWSTAPIPLDSRRRSA